jgi:RNA polymerase sigma-70 factor (ECF subfamily)
MPFTHAEFERLYNRYHAELFGSFLRQVHDLDLARDLLAATFLYAWEHGDEHRGRSEEQSRAWLQAIAFGTLRDHRRRDDAGSRASGRLPRGCRSLADEQIERLEDLHATRALRRRVAERQSDLPEEQRLAVRLRIVDELPYEEVARRMDSSTDAARMRVSRGLRTLKAWLGSEYAAWRRDQSAAGEHPY